MDVLSDRVQVVFTYLPVVNFAIQQNKIPVIREFIIRNKTEETIRDLTVNLKFDPEFGSFSTHRIDYIPPCESIRVDTLSVNLFSGFFMNTTEKTSGHFILELFSGEEVIFRKYYPVEVLTLDQWGGLSLIPEMVASFVLPNNPAIPEIIKKASVILEEWTGSSSMDGYQSRNPDRVKKQIAAIYTALSRLGIIYCGIPAGFEEYGQRIRLADTVIKEKTGNCLDLSLLLVACLEAIGIHPLVIFTQGHAFAGGWLVPETFPDPVIDDSSLITKRTVTGIHEIILAETTCMTEGITMDFDDASQIADTKMLKMPDFILGIDIKRTRLSGIRPLPQRYLHEGHWEIKEETDTEKDYSTPEVIHQYDLSEINEDIPFTKQLLWERKLLDLSLRNNLLNIRITKNTLQLIPADLDKFENALVNGEDFQILSKPGDWQNEPSEYGIYNSIEPGDPVIELIKTELSQKKLRSYLETAELNRALLHLYRSSRLSLEENGANTLYLALGLIRWYETETSERPRYAPVLLIPVEIIRKSIAKGYVIRSREEDILMNITLLEMLRQNFGIQIPGLTPLPANENGVDINLIFTIIRNSIKDQKRWDVEEQALLGIFSFNKFIMWNDIHNNSGKLIKNKIVSSLVSGKIEWDVSKDIVKEINLDKNISPQDVVLPISADSSQLEAIYEAVNDKSFILHGPPGTGKSQTITNIIANALFKGKRILFVAEKMAALSVVQNRLAAIGLDPFCLELHSNKAKKSAILNQLKICSEVVKLTPPEEFSRQAERLAQLRSELNIYIDSLHKNYPFGFSAYDAITRYLSIKNQQELYIPQKLLEKLTNETITEWNDALELLVSTCNAVGHPYKHPLTGIRLASYSAQLKTEVTEVIHTALHILGKLERRVASLPNVFGQSEGNYSKYQLDILQEIIEKLLFIPELTPALLKQPHLNDVLDDIKEVIRHGKERDKVKAEILNQYNSGIFTVDPNILSSGWQQASGKWFLPKQYGQRKVKKTLSSYATGIQLEKCQVPDILEKLITYKEENNYIHSYSESLGQFFGKYGKKDHENWDTIQQIIEDTYILNTLFLDYSKDIVQTTKLKKGLGKQLAEGIQSFKSIHGELLVEINNLLSEFHSLENKLQELVGIEKELLYETGSKEWIENASNQFETWLKNIDKLKDWYQWLSVSEKFRKLKIEFVAEEYKTKNIPTAEITDIFHKSFYRACVDYIISKEPSLEFFKGKMFNDTINRYKKLTYEFEELTKKELYAKLASNIPNFTLEAAQNSEVGIFQRSLKNNGRGMSVRKLFDSIPTLLSRMCPCMLMSPISVAQYIDPEAEKFDLVLFDEASQMPTYEAVGAIARGNNVVIVGDPKQLPPTNFFNVNNIDEDNLDMEDLESILDDCLALSIPSKHLLWHYRSKHESLIAFSNSEYYENKLLTFPSPDNIETKVRFIPVEGYYDKGKSRQNKSEAAAIVQEITRRLSDEQLAKKSIGVVTFSAVQQTLIEDLLAELFMVRPDLENIAQECKEPLFIKNLENVQGDERDVILFSVGYGPDNEGRISMNFGPLNRLGGERRLNVAVSRARYEMVIFSTLQPEQIDLNKTSSAGVAGLKRFLEYGKKGRRIVAETQTLPSSAISIENIIAEKLRNEGYTVHTNIGCSGYKIDLGIVDPSNSSAYLLGILCDGESYKKTKATRDREIIQNKVLKSLGWNVHNVWTMDWWENPQQVIDSIKTAIDQAKEDKPEEGSEEEYILPEILIAENNSLSTGNTTEIHETNFKPAENNPSFPVKYEFADILNDDSPAESVFQPESVSIVESQIKQIIKKEAPISKSLITKKIQEAWGIQRMSSKLDNHVSDILNKLPYYKKSHDFIIFFWLDKEQCKNYRGYRIESNRDATDLPPEEIANCIKQILEEQISLPLKDLIRIAVHQFGFTKSGSNIEAAMQRGIQEAEMRNFIKIDNGRAIIK